MNYNFFDDPFNYFPQLEFTDFENIWDDNNAYFSQDGILDIKPQMFMDTKNLDYGAIERLNTMCHEQFMISNTNENQSRKIKKLKSAPLELDEIQKYFNVPITEAAKELKVGVTVLKKRCIMLNIMRWPHRKIKSMKSLIDNVKV